MASNFGVSGLASGIDWMTMVDQLMQIERQPVARIEDKKSEFEKKVELWQSINTQLATLRTAADTLRKPAAFRQFSSSLSSSSGTDPENLLAVQTSDTAVPGNYNIVINQKAMNQKISSDSFSTNDTALNLSGELLVNGQTLTIDTTDSLNDIRDKFNATSFGENSSEVTATIVESGNDDYRLILTSNKTGAEGFQLSQADGGTLLQDLGLADSTTSLGNLTSDGAKSGAFSDADEAVGDLLNLSDAQSSTVTIGGQSISIDLATDSLVDIAAAIDAQAGISASVVTEENSDGDTVYRVDVSGTTTFTDSNNILQTLGFLDVNYSDVSEVKSSDVANQELGGGAITDASLFSQIDTTGGSNDVTDGDTITIAGTDSSGNAVSAAFEIDLDSSPSGTADYSGNTIADFLSAVEDTFGGSSVVDAYISDGSDGNTAGTMVVTDLTAGSSTLEVELTTNNEGGGTLDFGTLSTSVEGRSMLLQAGQDAKLTVDGMFIQRSDNNIDDVIGGVTMDLLGAEPGTTISLSIDRDKKGIREKVNSFIEAYNSIIETINKQFSFDQEKGKGGILFGDGTLRSIQTDIHEVIIQRIDHIAENVSTLKNVGIELDNEGKLSLDSSRFDAALADNFQDVHRLFLGTGFSDNSQIRYGSHTRETEAGVYDVNITQVATKANVTGTADLTGGLTSQQSITISTTLGDATFTFGAGTDIDSIVAAINSEMDNTYAQTLTEATGHSDLGGSVITASTTLDQIDTTGGGSNDLSNGEQITINGIARNGDVISESFALSDVSSQSVDDLLNAIEDAFNGSVTASIDSNGAVKVVDNTDGTSQLSLSLTYSGGGSLSFDTMDETTTGRFALDVRANEGTGGELELVHTDYGSHEFTVTSDAEFGITDGTYTGQDVAGTINGEAATGAGQRLKGDSGEANIDGLSIQYTGTATGDVGDITVSFGIAELLYQELYTIADNYDGYVSQKIDSLNASIRRFDRRIEDKEAMLEQKREAMIRKFVAMEQSIAQMQSQSTWLQSQITGLMSSYL